MKHVVTYPKNLLLTAFACWTAGHDLFGGADNWVQLADEQYNLARDAVNAAFPEAFDASVVLMLVCRTIIVGGTFDDLVDVLAMLNYRAEDGHGAED